MVSGKGARMYKDMGPVRFADLFHFTKISHENDLILSH